MLLMAHDLMLQITNSGVVPYLGTYLTVLTMLDTALPDTVEVMWMSETLHHRLILNHVWWLNYS